MKTSSVSLESLLGQISEEQINRNVDQNALRAGWDTEPTPCNENDEQDNDDDDDERCKSEKEKRDKDHKEHEFCGWFLRIQGITGGDALFFHGRGAKEAQSKPFASAPASRLCVSAVNRFD